MTAFVLGSNGFIGERLVSRLLEKNSVVGYDLCRIDDMPQHDAFSFVCGDFSAERNFEQILKANKVEVLFHLISTTIPHPNADMAEKGVQENVTSTIRLLEAAANANCRVIFISSGGTVYGEGEQPHKEGEALHPICSYGIEKLAIENYLHLFHVMRGLDYRIARVANVYGVCMQKNRKQGIIPIFLQNLYEKKPITLFGNTLRDYVYIDDVIDALVALGKYTGKERVFNIGTGIGTTQHEVVYLIEKLNGLRFPSISHRPIRICDVQKNVLDIQKAKEELNWSPKNDLSEGIRKTIRDYIDHIHPKA